MNDTILDCDATNKTAVTFQASSRENYVLKTVEVMHDSQNYNIIVCSLPAEKNLIDLPFEVEQAIKKLDATKRGLKNWHDVGCKFNVPEEDLDSAELEYHRPAGSPTKALLNILHTKYNVTLQRFVTEEIERNDIAHIICHYYKIHKLTTNRSQSSATIESYV